jgi:hypothetical protein
MVPVVQGLPVLQLEPGMHSEQVPPLHTPPVPQGVPGGRSEFSTHRGVPPAQSVLPLVHGLLVLHTAPSTHTSQLPVLLQARPVPQPVPGGRSAVSTHTPAGSGPEQSRVPVVQGLLVLQREPSMHSVHAPELHTPVDPQGVPGGRSSVSIQMGEPEPQSTTPLVQGLPVVQLVPAMHTLHSPVALQARPSSQGVPSGRLPLATQVSTPPVQSITPDSHGLPVSQAAPGTHIDPSTAAPSTAASTGGGERQKMLSSLPGGQFSVAQPAKDAARAQMSPYWAAGRRPWVLILMGSDRSRRGSLILHCPAAGRHVAAAPRPPCLHPRDGGDEPPSRSSVRATATTAAVSTRRIGLPSLLIANDSASR